MGNIEERFYDLMNNSQEIKELESELAFYKKQNKNFYNTMCKLREENKNLNALLKNIGESKYV